MRPAPSRCVCIRREPDGNERDNDAGLHSQGPAVVDLMCLSLTERARGNIQVRSRKSLDASPSLLPRILDYPTSFAKFSRLVWGSVLMSQLRFNSLFVFAIFSSLYCRDR